MKNTTNHITIKISKIIISLYIALGIFFLLPLLDSKTQDGGVLLVISLFFFIYALWLYGKSITIANMDAKYKSWFSRKSIKNIESINTFGFWILNSVAITGRGTAKIKLYAVANLKNVRKIAENIEQIKD